MAGASLTITVEDAEFRAALARMGAPDTGDLMPRIGEYLLESTQKRFVTQTAPDGEPWAKLQPSYARQKKYHRDKILTLRGYLRSGIRYQVQGPLSVQVGTNTKYAAIHQFGGTIDRPARPATVRYRSVAGRTIFAKKRQRATTRHVTVPAHKIQIPPRPFLGVSAEDSTEIQRIISDWVIRRSQR